MKLYTEKDLIQAIAFGFGICHKEGRAPFNKEMIEFIASLEPTTPIEIPSDEEIREVIKPFQNEMDDFDLGFRNGVQWLREKIQGGEE